MHCSIIVPTYNRPKHLAQTLQALSRLETACEIVVVDDGSAHSLRSIVQPFRVILIEQANAGPAAARNAGACAASGDLLLFTDDDCRPEPNWVSAFLTCHQAQPNALLGGRVINAYARNPFATATQQMIDFLRGDPPTFFPSNNIAIGRNLFLQMGGFSTDFPLAAGEDRDFCDRASSLVYCPTARVHHFHRLTPYRFWRQHANYGRGARLLRTKRRDDGVAHFSPLRFYLNLLRYPLRQDGWRGLPTVAALVLSQLATTYGFLTPNRRSTKANKKPNPLHKK